MAGTGEVVARDGGYELNGRIRARQERQRESRRAETRRWDETWDLAVVAPGRRSPADRAALRQALTVLRMGELREGVWTRPANLPVNRHPEARAVADDQVIWWSSARPATAPDAAALWDLTDWADDAAELRAEMGALMPALNAGDTGALAAGFVTSAAVLRHFQHDPLLPPQLLPRGWPGDALRADYDRFDAAYRSLLRDWFAATT